MFDVIKMFWHSLDMFLLVFFAYECHRVHVQKVDVGYTLGLFVTCSRYTQKTLVLVTYEAIRFVYKTCNTI